MRAAPFNVAFTEQAERVLTCLFTETQAAAMKERHEGAEIFKAS
jgi:hypothetical protein